MIEVFKKGELYRVSDMIQVKESETGRIKLIAQGAIVIFLELENDSTETLELFNISLFHEGSRVEIRVSCENAWVRPPYSPQHSAETAQGIFVDSSIESPEKFLSFFLQEV